MKATQQASHNEDRFYTDLLGNDELGVVIRAHMQIERHLNECIELLIPHTEHLKPMHLDFSQRVHLLMALGLRGDKKRPLLALGKLRNDFAHELESSLTEERVESFYKTFSSSDKEAIQTSYDSARIKSDRLANKKIKRLTPKDRFIIYVVTLRAALLVATKQVNETLA